ncbi:hypothetical protein [uncultured Victivallis sp.]|uniref:hypothetical protein n=1 Tax=uncultured Victivallis sp. TaxID=354118 RepID=UPI00258428EC|nr:hypothetical protein [uncultured Victivallis sp.]
MDICRFYPVGVFQRTAVVLDGDPLLTFGTPAGRNAMDGQGLRQVGGGRPFLRGYRSRFGLYGFLSAASCSGSGGVSFLLFADSAVRPSHRKRHEKLDDQCRQAERFGDRQENTVWLRKRFPNSVIARKNPASESPP